MKLFKTRKFQIPTEGQPTVLIVDDGHTVRAEWSSGSNSSTSIGIRRPPPKPGDTVAATFSLDGRYFYLPGYVPHDIHGGNWMGVTKYASNEEAKLKCKAGLYGPNYIEIQAKDQPAPYYRELLSFSAWKVDAEHAERQLATQDEMVKDFLAMCYAHDMQSMQRFNDAIAFTGRDYAWILKKIGAPVPADVEPVPPILTD